MKVEIINQKEEVFQPVTLQLTFETQEEINAMYNVVSRGSITLYNEAINTFEVKDGTSNDWDKVSTSIYSALKTKVS